MVAPFVEENIKSLDICKSLGIDLDEMGRELLVIRDSYFEMRKAEFFDKDDLRFAGYTWSDLPSNVQHQHWYEIYAKYLAGRPNWYQRLQEQNTRPSDAFIEDVLANRFPLGRSNETVGHAFAGDCQAMQESAEGASQRGEGEIVDVGPSGSRAPAAQPIQRSTRGANIFPSSSTQNCRIRERVATKRALNIMESPPAPIKRMPPGLNHFTENVSQRSSPSCSGAGLETCQTETDLTSDIIAQSNPSLVEHNQNSALAIATQTPNLKKLDPAKRKSTRQSPRKDRKQSKPQKSKRSPPTRARILATSPRRDVDEETCYTFDSDEDFIGPKISLDSNGIYLPDKLMDVRKSRKRPNSGPPYVQDIISGKRRVVTLGRPLPPPLPPPPPPPTLSPVKRLSVPRKCVITRQVAARRQKSRGISSPEHERNCKGPPGKKRLKATTENESPAMLEQKAELEVAQVALRAAQASRSNSPDSVNAYQNKEVTKQLALQISAVEHQQEPQQPETVNSINDEIMDPFFESSADVRDEARETSRCPGGTVQQSGTEAVSTTSKSVVQDPSPLEPCLGEPFIDKATFDVPSESILSQEQSQSTSHPLSAEIIPPVREERGSIHTTHLQIQDSAAALRKLQRDVSQLKREILFYQTACSDPQNGLTSQKIEVNVLVNFPSLHKQFEQKLSNAMREYKVVKAKWHEARKNHQLLSNGNPVLTHFLDGAEIDC